jgi:hypothetical protein
MHLESQGREQKKRKKGTRKHERKGLNRKFYVSGGKKNPKFPFGTLFLLASEMSLSVDWRQTLPSPVLYFAVCRNFTVW